MCPGNHLILTDNLSFVLAGRGRVFFSRGITVMWLIFCRSNVWLMLMLLEARRWRIILVRTRRTKIFKKKIIVDANIQCFFPGLCSWSFHYIVPVEILRNVSNYKHSHSSYLFRIGLSSSHTRRDQSRPLSSLLSCWDIESRGDAIRYRMIQPPLHYLHQTAHSLLTAKFANYIQQHLLKTNKNNVQ